MNYRSTWTLVASLALAVPGDARPDDATGGWAPPAPPAEALQACSGSQEGASCAFALGGNTVSGACHTGPQGEPLACVPPPPPHGRHGPPPEAFAACANLAEGAPCSVALGGTEVSGICRRGPGGTAVACAPSQPPPPR